MWLCVKVLTFYYTASTCLSAALKLTTPNNHVILSGPLDVTYSLDASHLEGSAYSLDLVHEGFPERTILNSPLPAGVEEGELSVQCGVIDAPGRYAFKIVDASGQEMARSSTVEAVLPAVDLILPTNSGALSSDLTLRMMVASQISCDSNADDRESSKVPPNFAPYEFQVLRQNSFSIPDIRDAVIPEDMKPHLVHSFRIQSLLDPTGDVIEYRLPCHVFDRPGLYYAALWRCGKTRGCREMASEVEQDGDSTMADEKLLLGESNFMDVQFGEVYTTRADRSFVFPCSNYVTISYKSSSCPNTGDVVRAYNMAPNRSLTFATERKATKTLTGGVIGSVTFSCFHFSLPDVLASCFRYVSVTSTGAVLEHPLLCLAKTEDHAGSWSEWSTWSECPLTTCHIRASLPRRYRTRECVGNKTALSESEDVVCGFDKAEVDWSDCVVLPCSTTERPKLEEFEHVSPSPRCQCGCSVAAPSGKLVVAREAPCYERNGKLASWTLRVHEDDVIRLTLDYFRPTFADAMKIWVKIHDGPSNNHNLLAFQDLDSVSYRGGGRERSPITITSSSNTMRVDLLSGPGFSLPKKETKETTDQNEGAQDEDSGGFVFVASFLSFDANSSDETTLSPERSLQEGQAVLENVMTVIGIGLCVGAVVASSLFVIKHRLERKRLMAELAKNTPAKQALLAQQRKATHSSCSSFSQGSPLANKDKPTSSRSDDLKTKIKIGSMSSGNISKDGRTSQGNAKAPSSSKKSSLQLSSKKSQMGSPSSAKGLRGNLSDATGVERQQRQQRHQHHQLSGGDETGKKEHRKRRNNCLKKTSSSSGNNNNDKSYNRLPEKAEGNGMDDSFFCSGRPPVEGRDSLSGDQVGDKILEEKSENTSLKNVQYSEKSESSMKSIPRGPAIYVPPIKSGFAEKRALKTSHTNDLEATEGSCRASRSKYSFIFEVDRGASSDQDTSPQCSDFPDDGLDDDFEYDDYVAHLPGSYFNMDPKAYTLTWSRKNEPWCGTDTCGRSCSDVGEGYIEDSI